MHIAHWHCSLPFAHCPSSMPIAYPTATVLGSLISDLTDQLSPQFPFLPIAYYPFILLIAHATAIILSSLITDSTDRLIAQSHSTHCQIRKRSKLLLNSSRYNTVHLRSTHAKVARNRLILYRFFKASFVNSDETIKVGRAVPFIFSSLGQANLT